MEPVTIHLLSLAMRALLLSDNQILFKISSPLLQLMILNLLSKNSSYGYEITNTLHSIYPISESSVYTSLKELSEKELVACEFKIIGGKLRKYYSITSNGRVVLSQKNPICRKQLNDLLEIMSASI